MSPIQKASFDSFPITSTHSLHFVRQQRNSHYPIQAQGYGLFAAPYVLRLNRSGDMRGTSVLSATHSSIQLCNDSLPVCYSHRQATLTDKG